MRLIWCHGSSARVLCTCKCIAAAFLQQIFPFLNIQLIHITLMSLNQVHPQGVNSGYKQIYIILLTCLFKDFLGKLVQNKTLYGSHEEMRKLQKIFVLELLKSEVQIPTMGKVQKVQQYKAKRFNLKDLSPPTFSVVSLCSMYSFCFFPSVLFNSFFLLSNVPPRSLFITDSLN